MITKEWVKVSRMCKLILNWYYEVVCVSAFSFVFGIRVLFVRVPFYVLSASLLLHAQIVLLISCIGASHFCMGLLYLPSFATHNTSHQGNIITHQSSHHHSYSYTFTQSSNSHQSSITIQFNTVRFEK